MVTQHLQKVWCLLNAGSREGSCDLINRTSQLEIFDVFGKAQWSL